MKQSDMLGMLMLGALGTACGGNSGDVGWGAVHDDAPISVRDSDDLEEVMGRGMMLREQLSSDELEVVYDLYARDPQVPAEAVARAIGLAWPEVASAPTAPSEDATEVGQVRQALEEGEDSNSDTCSVIFLRGRSDGAYHFEQYIYGGKVALIGSVTISTDGNLAIPDFWDLEASQGQSVTFVDTLLFTGILPFATTMSGWMVTDAGDACFGSLYAYWQ